MSSNHRWSDRRVENRNPSQLVALSRAPTSHQLPLRLAMAETSRCCNLAPPPHRYEVGELTHWSIRRAGALQSGQSFFVDATSEEEALAQPGLAVAVNGRGEVCGVLKLGRTTMDAATLHEMLQVSQQLATQLHAAVDAHVASQ